MRNQASKRHANPLYLCTAARVPDATVGDKRSKCAVVRASERAGRRQCRTAVGLLKRCTIARTVGLILGISHYESGEPPGPHQHSAAGYRAAATAPCCNSATPMQKCVPRDVLLRGQRDMQNRNVRGIDLALVGARMSIVALRCIVAA